MLNRILLTLVVIGSLTWIAIVGYDILSENNNYSPEYIFGSKDEKVLIINRPNEVIINNLPDFVNAPMINYYNGFNDSIFERAYISAKQPQLLLTRNSNWDEAAIGKLFADSITTLIFGSNSFTYKDLTGKYYKKSLLIFTKELKATPTHGDKFQFDKKSSASIVQINESNKVASVTDIYFKGRDRSDYITYDKKIQQGNQRKDELIFAPFVSSTIDKYHFYERDYFAQIDSVFSKSPMFSWMSNGFIEIRYKGSKALITDYIEGQDPILLLNDLSQTLEESKFSIPLMTGFPSSNKQFHVKYLEDLVVISENEETCDQLIADYKLGNTISLNKSVRFKIYGALPQSVSERFIDPNGRYTKAVYKGKLLETQLLALSEDVMQEQAPSQVALNCEFDISDFVTLPGKGNVIALGKKGEIKCFKEGQLKWSKKLETVPVGELELIDLYQTGESFILVTTKDKVHLFNLHGDALSGFPIKVDGDIQCASKFYRWKGSSYFLVAINTNEVVQFDGKGRELNSIKVPFDLQLKPDVWASQGQLFAGFTGSSSFEMYHLEKRKEYRSFAIPDAGITLKIPNELVRYVLRDGQLAKVDQKGIQSNLGTYNQGKLLKVIEDKNTTTIIVQSANEIYLLNSNGISFGQISLPFNEIGDVFVQTFDSGKTMIAVVDALENNVYLYGLDGRRINDTPIEGQTKVHMNAFSSSIMVTTVVDQFIVQYFK